jgi:hypothetical protein
VQRLVKVTRGGILVREQQRQLERSVAVCHPALGGARHAVHQRLGAKRDRASGREIRSQVAASHLAGRPPQRTGRNVAHETAMARGALRAVPIQLGAQVQRRAAGQKQPSQHRGERMRLDGGTERSRNRCRGAIRLLGRETALLYGERGGVASGEDVPESHDAPASVRGDEPLLVARQAGDPGALQIRQREHGVGDQGSPRLEPQDVVGQIGDSRLSSQLDPALGEQLAQRRSGGLAEDPQRLRLGRHERHGYLGHRAGRGRRHDRQLVCRKRPAGPMRDGDHDLAAMAACDFGEHPLDRRHVGRSPEGQCPGDRLDGLGADRDEQVVETVDRPTRHDRLASLDVDSDEPPVNETDRVAAGQLLKVERRRRPEPERRGHRRRSVLEGVRRGEQVDVEAAAGEVPQGQHRLHGGDP